MGILSEVKNGNRRKAKLVVEHGVDGVGKTTLVRDIPGAVLLGPEDDGKGAYLEARDWKKLLAFLDALAAEQHSYTVLGIDSVDWCEALLFREICASDGVENIEKYDGGYGKGYVEAVRRWRDEFLPRVQRLIRERNMHVILIAHSFIKTFTDPQINASYDRYILKLNEKAAALLREAADMVLFLNFKTNAVTDKGKSKARAFGDGSRVMYTERRPAFDAKNRDNLPAEIEFGPGEGWKKLMAACEAGNPNAAESVKKEIENLLTMVPKDDELYAKVTAHVATIGNDAAALIDTRNRLQELLQQK